MPQQISARLPNTLVDNLDNAARELRRSRADVVRLAIEHYLDDFDDLAIAIDRICDPNDSVLDWDKVRGDFLNKD